MCIAFMHIVLQKNHSFTASATCGVQCEWVFEGKFCIAFDSMHAVLQKNTALAIPWSQPLVPGDLFSLNSGLEIEVFSFCHFLLYSSFVLGTTLGVFRATRSQNRDHTFCSVLM